MAFEGGADGFFDYFYVCFFFFTTSIRGRRRAYLLVRYALSGGMGGRECDHTQLIEDFFFFSSFSPRGILNYLLFRFSCRLPAR